MYDLGDTILLPDEITAKIVGWRRMLGGNVEWCIRWWDERNQNEIWMTGEELKLWEDSQEGCSC